MIGVFRRLSRVVFRLTLIAAIGYGIAVVVKKVTGPADAPMPIDPWPPLAGGDGSPASTDTALTSTNP